MDDPTLEDEAPARPGVVTDVAGWAAARWAERRDRARIRRARRIARLLFLLADLGRSLACYLAALPLLTLIAAVYDLPLSVPLIAAAIPAGAGGRLISEKRPLETFKAWREAEST